MRLIVIDTLDTGHPGGRLGVPRLDWVAEALACETQRPTVIAMHHPPFAKLSCLLAIKNLTLSFTTSF